MVLKSISKLRRQKEKPTGSAARLDSSPDSDSSCSTDLDSSSSPHSNSSSSSDFDYSSFSSDGDTSSNGDTSSDGDALSDNDDVSDDASSDGASDGDSSSEFSSADEEERDDLDAARNWPPYEIDADDTEARITKTGYEVTFLLTDDDATLADLDKEEQIDELASLLRQNRSFGNFQYLLPPPDKADQLLPLTSCIPTNVVAVPDDGLFAIQPLPSSLNRDIGLGLFSNLTYYCYAIEAYAETEQEAEAFVAFMKSPAMRQRARELGQLRTLEIWYEGIATFRELGGWAGELARLFAYVGESDGWDRLDKNGNAPIRPLHHLVGPAREKALSFHSFPPAVLLEVPPRASDRPGPALYDLCLYRRAPAGQPPTVPGQTRRGLTQPVSPELRHAGRRERGSVRAHEPV